MPCEASRDGPTTAALRILHLEDCEAAHELVEAALQDAGMHCSLVRVDSLADFRTHIAAQTADLVLADYYLPGFTGIDAWNTVAHLRERPPFILLSAAIGEVAAVEAMRRGVSDYVPKDKLERLPDAIRRAVEMHSAELEQQRIDAEVAASGRRAAELSEYLQSCIEQERVALAREVHDDIGGALAAVKMDLAWIGRHTQDSALLDHVYAATEMLQHALDASQRIVMNLRPPVLDQGLVPAIHWLAVNFEKRSGVKTEFFASNEKIETTSAVQLVAYRTAQEALTNISKHAQCSAVTIDLSDREDVLTLEIADNGRGLQRSALEKPKAFGLKGLSERAKTVNGWLDISNRGGVGTSIILSVPLHHAT